MKSALCCLVVLRRKRLQRSLWEENKIRVFGKVRGCIGRSMAFEGIFLILFLRWKTSEERKKRFTFA